MENKCYTSDLSQFRIITSNHKWAEVFVCGTGGWQKVEVEKSDLTKMAHWILQNLNDTNPAHQSTY